MQLPRLCCTQLRAEASLSCRLNRAHWRLRRPRLMIATALAVQSNLIDPFDCLYYSYASSWSVPEQWRQMTIHRQGINVQFPKACEPNDLTAGRIA